jgi:1,2-diacylglycerol 3-alpha-glucosyltransferase
MSKRSNNEELLNEFNFYCDLLYLHEFCFLGCLFSSKKLSPRVVSLLPLSNKKIIKTLNIRYIHVIDEITLVTACRFRDILTTPPVISVGVYHSKLFTWGNSFDSRYFYSHPKKIFSSFLPSDNILFFNQASLDIAISYFKKSFPNSPVIPIGVVDNIKPLPDERPFIKGKIVSVGRLVEFKSYNENVIRAIYELKEQCALDYYIYGDGPNEKNLKKLVSKLGLKEKVHFMGSGTSIVEASALGVPSLVGVESSDKTVGMFGEISGFDYNELTEACVHSYSSYILKLYRDNRYLKRSSALGIKKSRYFSMRESVRSIANANSENWFANSGKTINFERYFFSVILGLLKSRLCKNDSYSSRLSRNISYAIISI